MNTVRLVVTETVRVLHVDDEPDFAEMTATFLEREDDRFVVETATRAEEGSEMLDGDGDGYEYDCVVSDYDMPGKNGVEFLGSVREEYPEVPFILFTGKGSEEVASEAISAGATDYLQKESGTDQYTVLANRIENAVERYRSERAVERNRERLSLFFEQSPLGAVQWDEEFRFERLNERAEEILGYTEEELRGESWEVIVAEEDLEHIDEVVDQLLRAEGGTHAVNKNVRKGGRTITCEWHNRAVTDEDEDVRAIFSKFQDITERKEREEELRTKNQAMDEAPVGVVITDPEQDDNPIVYANERFREMTGYGDEDILGRNCRFLQGEETEEKPVRRMREAIDACEPVTVTLRNYTKDGSLFWNRVSIAPLLDSEGEATNFVGFQEDVAEIKDREEQLESYREYTDSILDASDDLFFVCDEGGELQRWNDRLNEATGYTDEEVASTNAVGFVPKEHRERLEERMVEVFETGGARIELPVLTKDGSTVPYEFTANRVEHPDGDPRLVGIGRDRTDRKEPKA
jgi:PAS domain S-box-containing protein